MGGQHPLVDHLKQQNAPMAASRIAALTSGAAGAAAAGGGTPDPRADDPPFPSFECALPGCTAPAHIDYCLGVVHDYCTRAHYLQHEAIRHGHGHARGGGSRGGGRGGGGRSPGGFDDTHGGYVTGYGADQHGGGTAGTAAAAAAAAAAAGVTLPTFGANQFAQQILARLGLSANHAGMVAGPGGGGGGGGGVPLNGGGYGGGGGGGYGGGGGHGGLHGGHWHPGGPPRMQDDALDIDSMTREEILALSERIGSVRVGLTRRQLSHLPVYKYRRPRPAVECVDSSCDDGDGAAEALQAVNCVICVCEIEEGEDVRTLPCTHVFHKGCIDKWLLSDAFGAKSCPVCMAEVKV
jgi:hypothetical protein